MKPFDLEAAKRGEPLVTRDGRKARFVAHIPEANEPHQLIAMIEGDGFPTHAHANGRFFLNSESRSDLFMAPKKRTVWANLYSSAPGGYAAWYDSEAIADDFAEQGRLGNRAWPLEIEE